VKGVNLKDSLSDAEVLAYWGFLMDEANPAFERTNSVRSVKFYSGAGELRAQLRAVIEMDDAGVYERLLADPQIRPLIAKIYAPWDMTTTSQTFLREVTPELLQALSSSG
jgi:hypothetical protein